MGKSRRQYYRESRNFSNIADMLRSYDFYYDRLKCLAINIFIWDVPEKVKFLKSYMIENMLFAYKRLAFFFDTKTEQYYLLPFHDPAEKNVYGKPLVIYPYSVYTSTEFEVHYPDYVILEDYTNPGISSEQIVTYFAKYLEYIDRLLLQNLNAQKTPYLLTAPNDDQKLAIKRVFTDLEMFEPAVTIDEELFHSIDRKSIGVLNLNAPNLIESLLNAKERIWKSALSALAIPPGSDKRERQIVSESMQNLSEQIAEINIRYSPRLEFCNESGFHVKYNSPAILDDVFLLQYRGVSDLEGMP